PGDGPALRLSRLLGSGLEEDGLQGPLPAAGVPDAGGMDARRQVIRLVRLPEAMQQMELRAGTAVIASDATARRRAEGAKLTRQSTNSAGWRLIVTASPPIKPRHPAAAIFAFSIR